jgi:Fic family protein
MYTFRQLDEHFGLIPADTAKLLSGIDVARGRQEAFRRQNPAALKTLVEVARIQSVDASNAIEGITASPRRLEALVKVKTTPANRSEQEIAGYRKVLDMIHSSAPDIPFKRSVVEQFHRDIYTFTPRPGGAFKVGPNEVREFHPDGTEIVVFNPLTPFETPLAMEELHDRFEAAWNADEHHRLLLIGAYVFDFLMIHPFQDGNGRMSRLLTLLLLYQAEYEVGRFISLEKLINDSRETYYDSLRRSTPQWREGQHDVWPWTNYFLGVLIAAYKEFEARVGVVTGRGSKAELVKQFIRSSVKTTFTFDEVRQAAPGVSDVYIGKLLRGLRDDGVLSSSGSGRGARWTRLTTDFE